MVFENIKKQADELLNKGKEALNGNPQVEEALRSEQAESVSDKVLDGAAGVADKITGGKFSEQIAGVRDSVDSQLGNE